MRPLSRRKPCVFIEVRPVSFSALLFDSNRLPTKGWDMISIAYEHWNYLTFDLRVYYTTTGVFRMSLFPARSKRGSENSIKWSWCKGINNRIMLFFSFFIFWLVTWLETTTLFFFFCYDNEHLPTVPEALFMIESFLASHLSSEFS